MAGRSDRSDYESTSGRDAAAEGSETPQHETPQYETPQYAEGATEYDGRDDLSIMHSDDALLDAFGGADPPGAGEIGERELDELLLAWRQDIDSEPMAELVDTDTAVATINAAAAARRAKGRERRRKAFVPVAAAAAVLAIAFTGTGLAARSAEPGDALWSLTQVLYTDHAHSIQAVASARLELDTADEALTHGQLSAARDALDDAEKAIGRVSPEDDPGTLKAEHRQLANQLADPHSGTGNSDKTSTSVESTAPPTTTSPGDSSSSQDSEGSEPSDPGSGSGSESETSSSPSSPSSESSPSSSESAAEGGADHDTAKSPKRDTLNSQPPAS